MIKNVPKRFKELKVRSGEIVTTLLEVPVINVCTKGSRNEIDGEKVCTVTE